MGRLWDKGLGCSAVSELILRVVQMPVTPSPVYRSRQGLAKNRGHLRFHVSNRPGDSWSTTY